MFDCCCDVAESVHDDRSDVGVPAPIACPCITRNDVCRWLASWPYASCKTPNSPTPGESEPRHSTPKISSPIRVMSRYSITISPGRPMRDSSLANREARKWMNRDACIPHEVENHILAIMPRFRFGNVVYHNPLPCQRPSPAPSLPPCMAGTACNAAGSSMLPTTQGTHSPRRARASTCRRNQ